MSTKILTHLLALAIGFAAFPFAAKSLGFITKRSSGAPAQKSKSNG